MSTLSAVLALLACPACHQPLELLVGEASVVRCAGCQRRYPVVDGIPVLIVERSAEIKSAIA